MRDRKKKTGSMRSYGARSTSSRPDESLRGKRSTAVAGRRYRWGSPSGFARLIGRRSVEGVNARSHTSPADADSRTLRVSPERRIESVVERFKANGLLPIYLLSYEEVRELFARLHKGMTKHRDAFVVDTVFPGGATGEVDVRMVRSDVDSGKLPIVIYLHGGGWVAGDCEAYDWLIREIAVGADAALFFVEYTLAPELQYPSQNEQAYAVLSYVVDHADELEVDAGRLAVIGDGAGGNMAAAITFMASEREGPKIVLQGLVYPILSDISENASYVRYAEGPLVNLADMDYFFDAYFPSGESREEITAFPLRATIEDLCNLPPTLIITCEHDVLRDEAEQYARNLSEAGVEVTSVRYNGTMHGFMTLGATAGLPVTRAAVAQLVHFLRDGFGLPTTSNNSIGCV